MDTPRVWHRDDTRTLATYRNVFLGHWKKRAFENYAVEAKPMCEALLAAHPGGMIVTYLVEAAVGAQPFENLGQAAEIWRLYHKQVFGVAVVVKGGGLQRALVRSAMGAVAAMVGWLTPIKVFEDMHSAAPAIQLMSPPGVFNASGLLLFTDSIDMR